MARLNQTQKYAIYWLNSQGSDNTTIAAELEITEDAVIKCLEKNQHINSDNAIKTSSSAAGNVKNKNLMINETSVKKNKTVMIMTKEASMQHDELKKNQSNKSSKNSSAIFKPKK